MYTVIHMLGESMPGLEKKQYQPLAHSIVCMPYVDPDLFALMCYLGLMQVPYQAEVTASE